MAAYGYVGDVEAGGGTSLWDDKATANMQFAEQTVRLGFIRKVFGLLFAQLAVTAAVAAAFILHAPLKAYVFANPWTFWAPFAASLALVLVLSCSESARRSHPTNLILLFAFTACEAVLVGTVSAMYDTQLVLLAAVMTAGITGCLAVYALQTKRDFTAAGGIMFSLLFCLITAGLLSVFFRSHALNIAIAAIGAAVFACYIVFDIQLMTGRGGYAISPDEPVLAALNIYLDMINLFLYLLRLLQEIQGNN